MCRICNVMYIITSLFTIINKVSSSIVQAFGHNCRCKARFDHFGVGSCCLCHRRQLPYMAYQKQHMVDWLPLYQLDPLDPDVYMRPAQSGMPYVRIGTSRSNLSLHYLPSSGGWPSLAMAQHTPRVDGKIPGCLQRCKSFDRKQRKSGHGLRVLSAQHLGTFILHRKKSHYKNYSNMRWLHPK